MVAKIKNRESIRFAKEKFSRGELAKEILKGLVLGGLIVASFALPNLPQVIKMFDPKNPKEKYKIKRALASLSKNKLIKITGKGGHQVVEITENGIKRVREYKFEDLYIERPEKWDNLWRVVMFDVPERHKKGRDALTQKLKEVEFYPLQKSVFVFPFKCKDELDFICEVFNIRMFVKYFLAKSVGDDDERLKKYYNLN